MSGKLSDPTGDTLAVAMPSLTAKSDRFKVYLKLDWESACLLTRLKASSWSLRNQLFMEKEGQNTLIELT